MHFPRPMYAAHFQLSWTPAGLKFGMIFGSFVPYGLAALAKNVISRASFNLNWILYVYVYNKYIVYFIRLKNKSYAFDATTSRQKQILIYYSQLLLVVHNFGQLHFRDPLRLIALVDNVSPSQNVNFDDKATQYVLRG